MKWYTYVDDVTSCLMACINIYVDKKIVETVSVVTGVTEINEIVILFTTSFLFSLTK